MCIRDRYWTESKERVGIVEKVMNDGSIGSTFNEGHLTVDVYKRQTYPDNPHEGEEFGYVLSGSISIIVGNKRYKAKKGESFYFEPKYKHYICLLYTSRCV